MDRLGAKFRLLTSQKRAKLNTETGRSRQRETRLSMAQTAENPFALPKVGFWMVFFVLKCL
jgi:hypothetical protein